MRLAILGVTVAVMTFFLSSAIVLYAEQAQPVIPSQKFNNNDPSFAPRAVPVFTDPNKKEDPKKDDRRNPDEYFPEAEDAKPVFPISLIKNKIETIKVGTSAYVNVTGVLVDTKLRCWLLPQTVTGSKNPERVVLIYHRVDGYHVQLLGTDQWEAQDFDGGAMKLLPVKSVQQKKDE